MGTQKKGSVPEQYLPEFCQELRQLYAAGITLSDGIELLRDGEEDASLREVLESVSLSMREGRTLAEAMEATGRFPAYLTEMLGLADATGRLEETLDAMKRYYVRYLRLKADVRSAITVPAVLLGVMAAVTVLLITQVLPVFDRVFSSLGAEMGIVAVTMMRLGGALAKGGTVLAVLLVLLAAAVGTVLLIPSLRQSVSAWIYRRWGGEGILGKLAVSRFASALAMSCASGMTVDEAVEVSARMCAGAGKLDEKTARCREEIGAGKDPVDALADSGVLPVRDCRLLKLAERTGSLPEALEELALRKETESLDRIDRTVGMLEPGIVLVTAALAGIILLSVMLPMMGLLYGI